MNRFLSNIIFCFLAVCLSSSLFADNYVRYKITQIDACTTGESNGCIYNGAGDYIRHYFDSGMIEVNLTTPSPAVHFWGDTGWAPWDFWGGAGDGNPQLSSFDFRFDAADGEINDREDCTYVDTARSYADIYDQSSFAVLTWNLNCNVPDNVYNLFFEVRGFEEFDNAITGSTSHPTPAAYYNDDTPTFNIDFSAPSIGIAGYQYKVIAPPCNVSQNFLDSGSAFDVNAATPPTTLTLSALAEGKHLRAHSRRR